MAERRPLVVKDGRIEEFPIGDTLPAALGGDATTTTLAGVTANTGSVDGGVITINADPTKIDISAGSGYVVDDTVSPPTVTNVTWTAFSAVTLTDLATATSTDIAINAAGAIVQQRSFTVDELRTHILLGGVDHVGATIRNVFPIQIPSYAPGLALRDFSRAVGDLNLSGNDFGAGGVNLSVTKSAGTVFSFGRNAATSKTDPHRITTALLNPVSFSYVFRNGTGGTTVQAEVSAINPANYDNASGTPAAVGVNDFSFQQFLYFANSNKVFVQYGTTTYNTMKDAIEGLSLATFPELIGFTSTMRRGVLIVKQGATDLSDTASARFFAADKYGSVAGSTGVAAASLSTSLFTGLLDTPANYAGQTLKALRVNAAETGLEFTDFPTGGLQNNYVATAAPTVSNDSGAGYAVGSQWIDVTNDNSYICVDASVGAAVWLQTHTGTAGTDGKTILNGAVDPTTEGVDGDFYINTVSNTIFGPKATTWPAGVSLIGPTGADGNVDAFYAAALNSNLGSAIGTSTSAFATKGNRLVANAAGQVSSVTFTIEAGGIGAAYEIVVGKLSDMLASATISGVYKQAIIPVAATETHTLLTPFSVIPGDILFFGLTKTDIASAADPMIRFYATNDDDTISPYLQLSPGASRSLRFTDNNIQNGDSPTDLAASWWAINIGFQPLNALIPAGGTTGQLLSKISNTDYTAQWVDPPVDPTLVNTMTARADIGASADLDTYTAIGFYHQNSNANAASGTNYPLPNAGMLEVLQDGGMVYQRYTDYVTGRIFTRTKYNTTWYAWRNVIDHLNFVSNGVAPTASPALTGVPTAPTAAVGTSTTQLATTAFTAGALAAVGWATGAAAVPDNNIDNITVAGNYLISSASVAGSPSLAGIAPISGSTLLQIQFNTTNATQFLGTRNTNILYVRQNNSGTWSSWRRYFDSTNLLGTVSQSGGAPTGAVIEAGSNANGEFTRFADGTLICSKKAVASQSVTTANGSGFTSTTAATWTYPSTFISAPVVTGSCFSTNRWVIAVASSTTASVLQAGFQSSATTVATDVMAVGRWF